MNRKEGAPSSGNDLRDHVAALEAALAERMGVVQELRESENRLRTLLENSPDTITVLDARGTLLYLNRTAPERRIADVIGTSSVLYMSEGEGRRFLEALGTAIRTGEPQTIDVETNTRGQLWWQTRLVPLRGEDGVPRVMGIGTDVTAQRRTVEALRRSEETLRLAVQAARMGLWSWDLAGDSFDLDRVTASIVGLSTAVSGVRLEHILEGVYPDDRARAAAAAQAFAETGELLDFEVRMAHPDGTLRSLLVSGRRAGGGERVNLIGSVFDVTERRRLEEQLRQAQKMDAVGQLTAGIAHNFNNLLAAIIPSIQLARREMPGGGSERLKDAEHAAMRAAELVRELMVFARHRRIVRRELLDLSALAHRTVGICRATFDRSVDIDIVEDGTLPLVMGEPGQLEQVLLNICLNARDALGSVISSERRIRLELDTVSVESPSGASEIQVRVRISDNGPGMTDAVRGRVFEPFFTTKEVGKGTGLGLATAYAIATDHGGRLSCDSVKGEGTTFTLLLPASSEQRPEAREVAPPVRGGSETILVVDDERLVRKAMRSILEAAGYRVLDAADGRTGFELFQREGPGIDLVLLDLSMPGIPGEAVLTSMLRERPDARVVLFTGHRPETVPAGARALLQKPVPIDELLRVVREVCDGSAAASGLT